MTESVIPVLPCGQRPSFVRSNGRFEPEGFRRHVRRCVRCAELTDCILVAVSPATRVTYSPRELANTLNLATRTIYRRIESGELQAYRIGGSLRIRWADVERWLDGCKV